MRGTLEILNMGPHDILLGTTMSNCSLRDGHVIRPGKQMELFNLPERLYLRSAKGGRVLYQMRHSGFAVPHEWTSPYAIRIKYA